MAKVQKVSKKYAAGVISEKCALKALPLSEKRFDGPLNWYFR